MQWGDEANGFKLAVVFTKTNFVSGEEVVALSILKNASTNTLSILDGNKMVDFKITLKDESGKEVSLTPYGKWLQKTRTSTWLAPEAIPPGETEKREFPISKIYDITVSQKYVFTAIRWVPSLTNTNITENMNWYEAGVTSNPAIFYIDDEKKKTQP